jgi:hypothetical protein
MDGWMDGSKSRFKDCLQQSKMIGCVVDINKYSDRAGLVFQLLVELGGS